VVARKPASDRHHGIKLTASRLDFEQARRGVTTRRLAELAGVSEVTLSRAKHGRSITEDTLRRVTQALLSLPLVVGADLLISEPAR